MVPIVDNGHGGVIGGYYQTFGKRSPEWDQGVLYEGMFNRWVVNRLIEKMDRKGIKYYHASPELADISLTSRVARANKIHSFDKNSYFLSIHANAGGGKGIEVFTSPGQTTSDTIASVILENLQDDLEGKQTMRFDMSDGDMDKEERFFVLTQTKCPAVLVECGFMDNRSDYKKLWDEKYLSLIVDSLFKSITQLR